MRMHFFALMVSLLVSFGLTGLAQETTLVDCEALLVHDYSVLEESLSVEEYPEVQLTMSESGAKSVWLGASLFSEAKGDFIKYYPLRSAIKIEASHGHSHFLVTKVRGSSADDCNAKLYVKERRSLEDDFPSNWSLLADLKCQ